MVKDILTIVCISDTHKNHRQLQLPCGDILIHCGDFAKSRTKLNKDEYVDFVEWFTEQEHKTKVLIAGNRDDYMHTEVCHKYRERSFEEIESVQSMFTNSTDLIYLQDSSFNYKNHGFDIRIWGSPWTKQYGKEGKSFQVPTEELKKKWALVRTM